jgi:hypothetical protein
VPIFYKSVKVHVALKRLSGNTVALARMKSIPRMTLNMGNLCFLNVSSNFQRVCEQFYLSFQVINIFVAAFLKRHTVVLQQEITRLIHADALGSQVA